MLDHSIADPSYIDPTFDCRSISFENPTGARGRGATAAGGRKGAPSSELAPGQALTIADISGPGAIRRIWTTVVPARPEHLRALVLDSITTISISRACRCPSLTFRLPAREVGRLLLGVERGSRGSRAEQLPLPFTERERDLRVVDRSGSDPRNTRNIHHDERRRSTARWPGSERPYIPRLYNFVNAAAGPFQVVLLIDFLLFAVGTAFLLFTRPGAHLRAVTVLTGVLIAPASARKAGGSPSSS